MLRRMDAWRQRPSIGRRMSTIWDRCEGFCRPGGSGAGFGCGSDAIVQAPQADDILRADFAAAVDHQEFARGVDRLAGDCRGPAERFGVADERDLRIRVGELVAEFAGGVG